MIEVSHGKISLNFFLECMGPPRNRCFFCLPRVKNEKNRPKQSRVMYGTLLLGISSPRDIEYT